MYVHVYTDVLSHTQKRTHARIHVRIRTHNHALTHPLTHSRTRTQTHARMHWRVCVEGILEFRCVLLFYWRYEVRLHQTVEIFHVRSDVTAEESGARNILLPNTLHDFWRRVSDRFI